MIFRKYYSFQSKQNPKDLTAHIIGQHLQVHGMDFEIYEKEDSIKIIPHAEDDDEIRTIPITRLRLVTNNSGGTTIKMMCKPRRIDSGGPTLLVIFLLSAVVGGIALYLKHNESYEITSYILMGIGVIGFILFWLRLESGYYDYIRKIKAWVKSHI